MFGLKLTSVVLFLSLTVASLANPVVRPYLSLSLSLSLMSCSRPPNTSRIPAKIGVVARVKSSTPVVKTGVVARVKSSTLVVKTGELPTGWAAH